ncbi:MAG: DinB family protein [Ferruginibacter sp.]
MQTEILLQSLIEAERQVIEKAKQLKTIDLLYLSQRQDKDSWTILECLQHLNLYGEFYLPQIEKEIQRSATKGEAEFTSGFLGNYFAKMMLPKDKINKMKTFKDKNPVNETLDKTVIDKFIDQQLKLVELLDKTKNISLNKIRVKTSISTMIRLKLGDTFQFFINHIQRHLKQIERIEADIKYSKAFVK